MRPHDSKQGKDRAWRATKQAAARLAVERMQAAWGCWAGPMIAASHVQAAGESAVEELAALLEESGASMHAQKESRAEKAAWWRTRIALDGRLQHLCAALQTRLGPWL